MYYSDYEALKAQKKVLEKAFKKGSLSEDAYKSKVKELDERLDRYDESKFKEKGFSHIKIQKGHFVLNLSCPCGWQGTVSYGKMDAKLLGKDRKGFIYFECARCKRHLQYDLVTGKVKTRKGILGFLLGRFG